MTKPILFFALFFLFVFVSGCLKFGNDEETTNPNSTQLARCRSEMYLNPSMKITPLGYRLEGSGIDDAIWFKFKTNVESLSDIFDKTIVDTAKFIKDYKFLCHKNELQWWDADKKKLIGEQITLPKNRCLNVGIEKTEDGYLVYIWWFET
jgi:hypothetical protein